MIVINLFGGPSSGKSTGAAYIYSMLKQQNYNAELVTEFAKDVVWDRNQVALTNQAYVFGQQFYRISRLEKNGVDIVVTDSPILNSIIYNTNKPPFDKYLNEYILYVHKYYRESFNYVIQRNKPYNPIGRINTEKESNDIFIKTMKMLDENGIYYKKILGSKDGYDSIVEEIVSYKIRGL